MTREQFMTLTDQQKFDQYLLLESELNAAEAELALYKAEPQRDDYAPAQTVPDIAHAIAYFNPSIDGDFYFVEPPADDADTRKLDLSGSLPHR